MNLLPHWVLTDKNPAFYDSESATALEQTAKIYGAMNTLIKEYNDFVDRINSQIVEFQNGQIADYELFQTAIRQEFQDFIDTIDLRMRDAESYMRDNLRESCEGLLDGLTKDVQSALSDVKSIKSQVDSSISSQDKIISNQNSILAGAINNMNSRLNEQDSKIDEAVSYMKDNLTETIETTVSAMIENGSIVMGLSHDAETESLTLNARNIVYDTDLTLGYDAGTEGIYINEN